MNAVRLLMQIELRNLPFAHDHAAHPGADNDAGDGTGSETTGITIVDLKSVGLKTGIASPQRSLRDPCARMPHSRKALNSASSPPPLALA